MRSVSAVGWWLVVLVDSWWLVAERLVVGWWLVGWQAWLAGMVRDTWMCCLLGWQMTAPPG